MHQFLLLTATFLLTAGISIAQPYNSCPRPGDKCQSFYCAKTKGAVCPFIYISGICSEDHWCVHEGWNCSIGSLKGKYVRHGNKVTCEIEENVP